MLSEEDIDAFWERVDKKRAEFWQEFFDKHFKANPAARMPLQAPTEARGEFNGGESYPTTGELLKRTSEAYKAIERQIAEDEERMKNVRR